LKKLQKNKKITIKIEKFKKNLVRNFRSTLALVTEASETLIFSRT